MSWIIHMKKNDIDICDVTHSRLFEKGNDIDRCFSFTHLWMTLCFPFTHLWINVIHKCCMTLMFAMNDINVIHKWWSFLNDVDVFPYQRDVDVFPLLIDEWRWCFSFTHLWMTLMFATRRIRVDMGGLWLVGSLKLYVSFAEYSHFYRAHCKSDV